MRRITAAALLAVMALGVTGAAHASKPKTVWEDAEGDADLGQGTGSIPGGFDLVEAQVARNKTNLEFTVKHADMPPFGSMPEMTRFLWSFTVDGKAYRFTVKSFDIGKPDVLAQNGSERVGRVDASGHFRLEDECVTDATLPVNMINCPPLEYLEGSWDAGEKSFTIVLPMKLVKAKPGSKIGPGPSDLCQICWVSHYAERSLNTTIIDDAGMTTVYKVPRK